MESRINVTKSSMPEFEEYVEEIRELWDTRWLTNMGKKHNELESSLRSFLDVENLSLLVNGHMALEIALQSLQLDGEVITTPFTFASTTHAIVRSGLKPVFCDINPNDYTMDVEKIEGLITDKTVAILPVHVYGNACDVDRIHDIAKKHNLKVIYDAAHAFGEKLNGTSLLQYGDMAILSFHATKVFHTIEGGAICYEDNRYMSRICQLRDFGIGNDDSVREIGTNAKMNEFAASMGICNLRRIEKEISKRKKVVETYREKLSGILGIKLNYENPLLESNYAYFPVYVDEIKCGYSRDDVCEHLKQHNIFARKYFYPLTNEFACYKGVLDSADTPVAHTVSRRIMTLPLYADMTIEEINRVCMAFYELQKGQNV